MTQFTLARFCEDPRGPVTSGQPACERSGSPSRRERGAEVLPPQRLRSSTLAPASSITIRVPKGFEYSASRSRM